MPVRTEQACAVMRNGFRVSRVLVGTGTESGLPFVSAVLPTIGRSSLRTGIRTILESDYPAFELLVVYDTKRIGSAAARNLGLELAEGDLVHFVEDDCEYTSSNIRALVTKYLDVRSYDTRSVGVVGSFSPAVWGRVAVRVMISISSSGVKTTPILGEGRTDYLATGNALCSKEAIIHCGGFNEAYRHIFEDLEISLVLKGRGLTLYNCAEAVAEHLNEPRLETYPGRLLRGSSYLRARNRTLMHKTWCGDTLNFVIKQFARDVRGSIRGLPAGGSDEDIIHWKRLAERRAALDRLSYILGVVDGLITTTDRQTIKS